MVRRWCVSLAGAALVIGAAAATSPAWAASAGGASHGGLADRAHPAARVQPGGPLVLTKGGVPQVRGGTQQSQNWSGFAATGSTYENVSASWVEPTVKCSGGGTTDASFWVGLDGDGSSTVEQTGSEAGCSNGSARYDAWWEMVPTNAEQPFPNTVKPGDHFSASVTHTGGASYKLMIKDTTQGWSHSLNESLASATNRSAEVIAEAPTAGGILPLADFGTVPFTNATVNGAALGKTAHNKLIIVSSGGTKEDTVTKLQGGESFSAHWLAS